MRCTMSPLLPDVYLEKVLSAGSRTRQLTALLPSIAAWEAKRWRVITREAAKYDVVYLEYEALPYAPAFLERPLFSRGQRVVSDYDDAVSVVYEEHSNPLVRAMLSSKVPSTVKQSTHVIAGNANLADWIRRYNPSVTVIPTSVDLEKFPLPQAPSAPEGRPVLVWLGTPSSAEYLQVIEQPLRALRKRHDFVLKVIGLDNCEMPGVDTVVLPWQEATELEEIQSSWIGLMPLTDDPYSRGKSGFKLVQYMAAGIPAVASPIGAACDIVRDGESGFLAGSDQQWTEKLAALIEKPALRAQFAHAGRIIIQKNYSLEANAPRFLAVLQGTESEDRFDGKPLR
jgi:glycosyltransferase involved in cell wall biosynthesis